MCNRKNSWRVSFKILLSSIVLASVLTACGSQPNYASVAIPKSYYSQQCFITQDESFIWLEQEDEWLTLPARAQQQFEQADINWLQDNVLIVSAGQKPTAGFDVKLTSWLLEQHHWQVERQLQVPKAGNLQAMMISSPCVLVKIPKSVKSFILNDPSGRALGRWMY